MFLQTLTNSPAVTIPNQTPLHTPPSEKKPMIDIRLINARNFTRLSRQKGNALFLARPDPSSDTTISAQSNNADPTSLLHTPTDTSSKIPLEYHEFLDVFSGERANQLPPYRSYNLRINLEEGSKPTYGPIYSLSLTEQSALQDFLDEHLHNGFIQLAKSPWGSPVLFVKKKDGGLRLCVDF